MTQSHPEFSVFGQKLTGDIGIYGLMEDLGRAMTTHPDMLMLGGGNPAAVPAMQQIFRERMEELLADGSAFDRMLGNYDPPQGNPRFQQSMADMLSRTYGWDVAAENIAITAGGQSAFFFLFNLLAGPQSDGSHKKILLPLCPEYIGYCDQGLTEDMFVACRPRITWPKGEASREFKYTIDFEAVETALQEHNVAAIAVSRPTNPTGNVITDDEVRRLAALVEQHGIYLILDNAYGVPFPGVVFTDASPYYGPSTILTLSLSKLGLPGTRTGIVVGDAHIMYALGQMNGIAGLANNNIGQQMSLPWIEDGRILQFGEQILRPYYQERSNEALSFLRDAFDSRNLNWAVHASEGAFFHWLWLPELSIPTRKFYERLKQRNVLVVPGEYFFFGMQSDWPHSQQCLRLSFAQPAEKVKKALDIIADEAQQNSR
ncbi:MAG: valine--pyruvate transaminase [Planctomycetaceae bacterium]|nr:valine--pyruvate transaminase [Planctomycetaceae bacterium]